LPRDSSKLEFGAESIYSGSYKVAPLLQAIIKTDFSIEVVPLLTRNRAHPSSINQSF
jgi:hypothetical protein